MIPPAPGKLVLLSLSWWPAQLSAQQAGSAEPGSSSCSSVPSLEIMHFSKTRAMREVDATLSATAYPERNCACPV